MKQGVIHICSSVATAWFIGTRQLSCAVSTELHYITPRTVLLAFINQSISSAFLIICCPSSLVQPRSTADKSPKPMTLSQGRVQFSASLEMPLSAWPWLRPVTAATRFPSPSTLVGQGRRVSQGPGCSAPCRQGHGGFLPIPAGQALVAAPSEVPGIPVLCWHRTDTRSL